MITTLHTFLLERIIRICFASMWILFSTLIILGLLIDDERLFAFTLLVFLVANTYPLLFSWKKTSGNYYSTIQLSEKTIRSIRKRNSLCTVLLEKPVYYCLLEYGKGRIALPVIVISNYSIITEPIPPRMPKMKKYYRDVYDPQKQIVLPYSEKKMKRIFPMEEWIIEATNDSLLF